MIKKSEYSFEEASRYLSDELGSEYTISHVIDFCFNGRLKVGYRMLIPGINIPLATYIPEELTPLLMLAYRRNSRQLFEQYIAEAEKKSLNPVSPPEFKTLVIYHPDLIKIIQQERDNELKNKEPEGKKGQKITNRQRPTVLKIISGLMAMNEDNYDVSKFDNNGLIKEMENLIKDQYGRIPKIEELEKDLQLVKVDVSRQTLSKYIALTLP